MRKIFILCFIALSSSIFTINASNTDLFSYNKNEVEAQLDELTQLENYVNDNQGVTLNDLQNSNSNILESLNLNESNGINFSMAEPPLGIPSFIWGCCLGFVGIGIVYFMTEDKEETKKALWGCILGTVVGTTISVSLQIIGLSFY